MKTEKPAVRMPSLGRREFVQATTAAALAVAASGATSAASAQDGKIEAQEHWAKKGNVDSISTASAGRRRHRAKPVLFLVHGSTFSCRGSYDLQVPGRAELLDDGPLRRARLRRVVDGPRGLRPLLAHRQPRRDHGRRRGPEGGHAGGRAGDRASIVLMHGQSSGAIRAGAFAVAEPARVERLVLDAFTYTGENAPEIERRRKVADQYGPIRAARSACASPAHLRSRHARHIRPGGAQGAGGLRAEIRQRGAERHLSRHGRQHADGRSREARPARSA